MSNSLVIAGQVELLGGKGGVASTNPRCFGTVFSLLPGTGHSSSVTAGTYDLSAPQPTTDFVASLLTDGERPQGFRASNRTITLPVRITAPSFAALAGAREVLLELVDQQFWPLTWTRDRGAEQVSYPLVFDCFRANPTTVMWGGVEGLDLHPTGIITLQFTALPYGRADVQTQMSFAAPVPASPPPPPAPVVLDAFATINAPQCTQSTVSIVGPTTCFWDPGISPAFDSDGTQTPLTYGQTFTTPLNLTSMTALQMWLGLGSRSFWNHHAEHGRARISIFFTLTDVMGNTLSFSRSNLRLPVAETAQVPKFSRVSVGIPQGNTVFGYSTVAAYSLVIINQSTPSALRHLVAYLDALTAYPTSATTTPVIRGNVYWLYGVKGTARSPVSMSFQAPPAAGTPTTLSGAGIYTVPGGTVYLKVEAWGGGGAGGGQSVSGIAGGGGSGEYAAELQFAAAVGQQIQYSVGAGGTDGATPVNGQTSVFGPAPGGTVTVAANGGQSVAQNSSTGGTGGSGSANSVEYAGAAGRTASGGLGGGGAASAGTGSVGNAPAGTGSVTISSGSGNWTAPSGVTQVTLTLTGGGGGGGCNAPPAGANGGWTGSGGGGGECVTVTVAVTPLSSYAYVVGTGGAGGSGVPSGGQPGASGNSTTITIGATTYTAHGGHGSNGGSGGAGGSGANQGTHFSGGTGGPAYPYTGGGGSSAGPAVMGNPGLPAYPTGGGATAPAGGGAGGNGSGSISGSGVPGSAPGGGGGGSQYSSGGNPGGNGATGQIVINYPVITGAPTNSGGVAPGGGGAGGAGGATAGTAGSAGSVPGGGGGGANSSGTTLAGGAGAAGKIVVTPFASLAFKNLIVHRPKYGCHPQYQPLVAVGNGADIPDGTHFYTVPQPQSGQNASFDSTYTVVLVASAFSNPTANRTITVTVTQTEYSGGPSYSQSTVPVTVAPSLASLTGPGNQVNNGILIAGVLTLPVKALAYDNTSAFFQVSVTDTNTSDRFLDVLLLDTQGQTLIINEPSSGYINYYADEPDPIHDLGLYLGSQLGRANAVSVVDAIQAVSGGPFTVEPRECLLFAYSVDGHAPSIGVSYYERFFFDHIST